MLIMNYLVNPFDIDNHVLRIEDLIEENCFLVSQLTINHRQNMVKAHHKKGLQKRKTRG